MIKILLDTHIALWALTDTAKLSEEVIYMLGCAALIFSMESLLGKTTYISEQCNRI